MKIRIHHQEIRFRLSPRDVETLTEVKSLLERLQFSNEVAWTYRLSLKGEKPEVTSTQKEFSISLPENEFSDWLVGPEIEWLYQQSHPELAILIEKDLKP